MPSARSSVPRAARDALGEPGVVRGAQRHRAGPGRAVTPQAEQLAALLVDRDEQRLARARARCAASVSSWTWGGVAMLAWWKSVRPATSGRPSTAVASASRARCPRTPRGACARRTSVTPSPSRPACRARRSAGAPGRRSSGTAMATNAPAVSRCQASPREPTSSLSCAVSVATSCSVPRNTSATSRSFHTQRNWKIAKDASAGSDSGSASRVNAVKWRGAVDERGLEEVPGELGHVGGQQEDRQRQAEPGVGQPDAQERAVEVQAGVDPQQRDQRHLQRHDEQADDHREQHRPTGEAHPRERVGGERGDGDRDQASPGSSR